MANRRRRRHVALEGARATVPGTGPALVSRSATLSRGLGARRVTPATALAAQSVLGNHATERLLRRPGAGDGAPPELFRAPTKPSTKAFTPKRPAVNKLEKAARDGDKAAAGVQANALHQLDAAFYRQLLSYKLHKHQGNAPKRQVYMSGPVIDVLKEAVAGKDAALIGQLKSFIGFITKDQLIALAGGDPGFFLDHVVKPIQQDPALADKFRELLLDNYYDKTQTYLDGTNKQDRRSEGLRGMLRDALGAKWTAFAKTVPVLALAEEAREHFDGSDEQPDVLDIVDRIFDSFVANKGISIGYFAGSKDRTEQIMMGKPGGEVDADLSGATGPLRTQCDDIMKILRESIRAYPGLRVKFKIGMEKQALLTVPLNTLPGGLIPNDFEGNVQDANGRWTKQIFFTGVTESDEPNSHTWLLINGKAYDGVLGTRGDQVAASRQGSFTQQKEMVRDEKTGVDKEKWHTVWKDSAGNTLTKLPGVAAPANPMGFNSAYRLEPPRGG